MARSDMYVYIPRKGFQMHTCFDKTPGSAEAESGVVKGPRASSMGSGSSQCWMTSYGVQEFCSLDFLIKCLREGMSSPFESSSTSTSGSSSGASLSASSPPGWPSSTGSDSPPGWLSSTGSGSSSSSGSVEAKELPEPQTWPLIS